MELQNRLEHLLGKKTRNLSQAGVDINEYVWFVQGFNWCAEAAEGVVAVMTGEDGHRWANLWLGSQWVPNK